jgi:hypothetical protein
LQRGTRLSHCTGAANARAQDGNSSQTQHVHALLNAQSGGKLQGFSNPAPLPEIGRKPVRNRLHAPCVPFSCESQMKIRESLFLSGQMR